VATTIDYEQRAARVDPWVPEGLLEQTVFKAGVRHAYASGTPIIESVELASRKAREYFPDFEPKYNYGLLDLPA
jgi:hypothetical protein